MHILPNTIQLGHGSAERNVSALSAWSIDQNRARPKIGVILLTGLVGYGAGIEEIYIYCG
jgi:hypothetical protein